MPPGNRSASVATAFMTKRYDSESIKVLSDLDHIRLRKEMYIGEASDPRQLISEIFDNAIDECQTGFSGEVIVSVDTKKNQYSVRDFGRGIPHGKKKLENGQEKETIEVLLTKANSGGKFDNSNYTHSCGLHGLGITVTNALSEYISITSFRKGKYIKADSVDAKDITVTKGKTSEKDGTLVVFCPKTEYFAEAVIPVSYITDRCRVASALGCRARLIVDGKEIATDASIFDLIKDDKEDISTYTVMGPFEVQTENGEKMKVALKYTSETNDRYFGYTNLLVNYLGGTHVQELAKQISATWEAFIGKHKNLRPATELKPGDYLVGLRAVCAVFIADPHFSSQTKEKLVVGKHYFDALMDAFSKALSRYLESNITVAHQLVKRFEEYRNAQNALLSRKEISSLIKVNTDDGDNIRRRSVVSKLVECTSKKKAGTELFLCLAGETPVRLLNGDIKPIRQLAEEKAPGERFWVCSCNKEGKFIPAEAVDPRITQYVRELYEISLSDGSVIRCTGNHRFLNRDTMTWVEAQNLRPDDSLFHLSFLGNPIDLSEPRGKPVSTKVRGRIGKSINRMLAAGIPFTEDTYNANRRPGSPPYKDLPRYFKSHDDALEFGRNYNYFVTDVKTVRVPRTPVYCLTVLDDNHAFALGNGLITHNCEGKSALGPYLFTRKKETQAILPLRGKILNVTYKSIKDAIQNAEICDIANSIGAGIGSACDASKSRYERIIISSDADEDGKHITSLLASMFVNLFPALVKAGMVRIVLPPLYCWGKDGRSYGWCNDINQIPKNVKEFHRFKGLGEMENDQLRYFCVDENTRREIILEYPSDIDEFNRILGSSQGKNGLLKEMGILVGKELGDG